MNQLWKIISISALIFFIAAISPAKGAPQDEFNETAFASKRKEMVSKQIIWRGVRNEDVVRAMMIVPRHRFVPKEWVLVAYDDTPLPIGHGQTISQPYIVAYMTQILNLNKESRVLEIGTGSGYQAAILSRIVKEAYTIEIIPKLAESASLILKKLDYQNVKVTCGDGYYGRPEHAPFDAIIVTAAAGHIPPPLIGQLKAGGRMIIPVGGPFMIQNLILVEKGNAGEITTGNLMSVRFVPLTGKHK
ncbi:MAG: protein-L-isoaspartate(D-aspartate) O-methyltransferase [Deltaproteobacteria bacterium]|nr:protein-L-isoaspartate(D-aspartate) O-methyltransferase [Deltaproteobacteria bacterium]